ncbi:MAG: hypothetical protein LPJ87_01140, partial [Zoogloeaceae bacterium]|nr:hypothetical protein [Zoogloeaceae bacterium]
YPVEINVTEALKAYYALASALSHHGEERRIRDDLYLVTKDVPSGISLGLPARVARRTSWEPVLSEFQRTTERLSEREKLYSDGIYIALDERWDPERMQKQPIDRGRG